MRRCYRCGTEQPDAAFIRKRNGVFYGMCSPCLSAILADAHARSPKRRLEHTATHRTCYLCRRVLAPERFTRRSSGTYFSACKDCNTNVFAHRRRARLLAVGGSFTTSEWIAVLAQHPACPSCHRRWEEIPLPRNRRSVITRDHVVPVSRGGRNVIENIRPLCYSCNSRKGDRV